MDKIYIVAKSNKLINCSYDLSLQEQKIILTLASMVQPQDTEFKEYEFKIKEFIDLLGLKTQTKYSELPKITKELKKKVFEIRECDTIRQVSWLGGVEYKTKEGLLILSLDKGLKPYMLELKELYTSYKLQNVLSLKSKYSIRIYEILKSNLFKKQIIIDLEELRNMLYLKEKSYSVYQNVKNKVIMQAKKELEALTDIKFEFEEIKEGRKVASIKFYIYNNILKEQKDRITDNTINKDISATLEEADVENATMDKGEDLDNLLAIMSKHKISKTDAKKIYKAADGDLEKIKRRYEYTLTQDVDNVVSYMVKICKEFSEPISNKSNKVNSTAPKNKFMNFPQRKYNFDEIEKQDFERNLRDAKNSQLNESDK